MKNRYKPTKGAQFNQAQAQAIGETLEKIGFHPKPEDLIAAARPANSPIHDLFEWDNTVAAERYRLAQARNLVNHLEIIIVHEGGERATKAYHSVIVDHGETIERGYCSLETIVENEDLNAQVINRAMAELRYWKAKYAEYKAYPELASVFKAIDTATARPAVRKRTKRRRTAGSAA